MFSDMILGLASDPVLGVRITLARSIVDLPSLAQLPARFREIVVVLAEDSALRRACPQVVSFLSPPPSPPVISFSGRLE
jgi:hypothetical protein